jgi:hypothetical protein
MLATIQFRIFCHPIWHLKMSRLRQTQPWFFYGCDIWSLTLKDEHRLGAPENRVVRRTCWPKKEEVTGSRLWFQFQRMCLLFCGGITNAKLNLTVPRILPSSRTDWLQEEIQATLPICYEDCWEKQELAEIHVGLYEQCPLILCDFKQHWNMWTNLVRITQYQILWKSFQQFSSCFMHRHGWLEQI